MQLHGSLTSPYVRHCRIVLLGGGIPFTLVETDYAASAAESPAMSVPFLRHGDLFLTDSSVILQYARRLRTEPFLEDLGDSQRYFLATAGLGAAINVHLLARDGVTPETSPYVARQARRVEATLAALEADCPPVERSPSDGALRTACFLGWGLFRRRVSLEAYPALRDFLRAMEALPHVRETAPPA